MPVFFAATFRLAGHSSTPHIARAFTEIQCSTRHLNLLNLHSASCTTPRRNHQLLWLDFSVEVKPGRSCMSPAFSMPRVLTFRGYLRVEEVLQGSRERPLPQQVEGRFPGDATRRAVGKLSLEGACCFRDMGPSKSATLSEARLQAVLLLCPASTSRLKTRQAENSTRCLPEADFP